jgi:hypothetical protein
VPSNLPPPDTAADDEDAGEVDDDVESLLHAVMSAAKINRERSRMILNDWGKK